MALRRCDSWPPAERTWKRPSSVQLGSHAIPLASDRTTPLAVQVAQGSLPTLEMTGLFDSDFKRPGVEAGLYLLR